MANTPLGYYEWYPRDFYTSIVVRSMSFNARSIYRELLDIQWENGCLTSVERLLNVIGATAEQWEEFAPFLDELFPNGVNKRLDDLRKKAFESQEKKSAAGRASAQKRLESNTSSTPVQQVFNQTETETETKTNRKKGKMDSATWKEFAEMDLPPSLNSVDGRDAWSKFCKHRSEKGSKLTSTNAEALLKKLGGYPAVVAVGCLLQSVENGWQGIFPDKYNPPVNSQSTPQIPTSKHGPGWGVHWGFDPEGNKEAYDEIGERMIAGESQ